DPNLFRPRACARRPMYRTPFRIGGTLMSRMNRRLASTELLEARQMLTAVPPPVATTDTYTDLYQAPLVVNATLVVLGNDSGGTLNVTSHTDPAHGTVTMNADGSFTYTPNAGFLGQDSFNYNVSNAAHIAAMNVPSLGTLGGVAINGGAFGSSVTPV